MVMGWPSGVYPIMTDMAFLPDLGKSLRRGLWKTNADVCGRCGMEPLIITRRMEEILRTVHFYRFMTALDVTHLLFSPGSKVYVRDLLTSLAGRKDGQENHYLYRFQLPHIKTGNTERVYTLGSRGRDFLANEAGLPVTWYYRPEKVKHFNYGHVLHNLILTRFLVSAHSWCAKQPDYNLAQTRICYELSKTPVMLREKGREE